jgi:phosphoribosylanthranilate isomerase
MSQSFKRTRIKMCGIRTVEHAQVAAQAGADALGFVFYGPSPRNIDVDLSSQITRALPPFIQSVALFVNPDAVFVKEVISSVQVDLLQFHGDEDAAFCAQFGRPYIKAIRVGQDTDLLKCRTAFSGARALLLDAEVAGQYGGTGHSFDWSRIPQSLKSQIVLSGGLTVESIGDAIRQVGPYAVDVSSGIESTKGVKSADLMHAFARAVAVADKDSR